MTMQVPALSAAAPSTARQLWKFGFSSSSSQMQDSKEEGGAQAAAEAAAGAEAAGAEQAAQEGEQQQQFSIEELQKANQELQSQFEEERKKVRSTASVPLLTPYVGVPVLFSGGARLAAFVWIHCPGLRHRESSRVGEAGLYSWQLPRKSRLCSTWEGSGGFGHLVCAAHFPYHACCAWAAA
jgi:hypothetical protein